MQNDLFTPREQEASMDQDYFTVSELNGFIKDVINAGFPQPMWICGEIQGFNRNRGKSHIFFELIEKDKDSSEVKAKIGLVIFAGRKQHIQDVLKRSENSFSLKDDIEVKFLCRIDFYGPHGAVRLIVESIDPTYTLGKLAQEKQKLIALLKENGTLDKNKQLEIPLVPLKIGLISADDSAAFNDFLSELERSGLGFQVYFRNALMQGKRAEKDICKAIAELNKKKDLDLIVITRGGGSIADLSCFDSKLIAEKIAASRLPIFSGIGHEINITITDLAANTYAKTPTAIAQHLVERVHAFLERLDEYQDTVITFAQNKLTQERQRLKTTALTIQHKTHQYLRDHNEKLISMSVVLKHKPKVLLKQIRTSLKQKGIDVRKAALNRLSSDQKKLKSYEKLIDIAHPINTMKRGFSITRNKEGKVVRQVKDVSKNDALTTEVSDGSIISQVTITKN